MQSYPQKTALFLSTPSARRATRIENKPVWRSHNFYPRPPRGGRPQKHVQMGVKRVISIHALREEGDDEPEGLTNKKKRFLSTPSARRATCGRSPTTPPTTISIHALREEGDPGPGTVWAGRRYFYPRPPRGGRLGIISHENRKGEISIHALREEGDLLSPKTLDRSLPFLSTPSARRATAKTETKSLFSNKLYNILHEFRRALIYNGSKNDPNHAK